MKFNCPSCKNGFEFSKEPAFCPFCGQNLNAPEARSWTMSEVGEKVSAIGGHTPSQSEIQYSIGSYKVLSSIGKGGMGEVLLAYDPLCGRRIALKRIRNDYQEQGPLQNRFLKEARITSQLTHPSIIPIYAIHPGDNLDVYYTMPFVEGQTLKQLFREARKKEKEGMRTDEAGTSIPALTRYFLSVCQAIAYAHSQGVLHRDIKPENIIIGKYGQVVILDWGLAKVIQEKETDIYETSTQIFPEHVTHLGRVVGTIAYMAPERALGNPATVQTDIYSLGVILYQILTLRYPFYRGTLKEFREKMHLEIIYDPSEVAPYRDVPRPLSIIVKRCLAPKPEDRYKTVDEMIHDIENYLEGRAEWLQTGTLSIENKEDWEFQENVLIAENVAITRGMDVTDWVILMISKQSYGKDVRLETRVRIGDNGHGIGFLLSVPEAAERKHPNDGFCVWLASDKDKNTKVVRSTVEVMHAPEFFLKRKEWYTIRIEKMENNIHCFVNDQLQFSYISHLPLTGTHVGLMTRDADFAMTPLVVSLGGQNVQISCLAIPDTYLSHKDYAMALSEYRRIGYAFSDRAEGREALFRAGITLLEQARNCTDPNRAFKLYDEALLEFGKLHDTPGAPLGYLGKGLVYHSLHDYEEEVKCYELACRRYPKHPLLPVLKEQILYRMHESSRYHPKATYHFILLAMRHIPDIAANKNVERLFQNLQSFWETLPFIEEDDKATNFIVILAFWLAKPHTLLEIIQERSCNNAVYCLIELGAWKLAKKNNQNPLLAIAIEAHESSIMEAFDKFLLIVPQEFTKKESRVLFHMINFALTQQRPELVEEMANKLEGYVLSDEMKLKLSGYRIWAFLLSKDWNSAGQLLQKYPIELLSQERTILYFLYGCWLLVTEGKVISDIHFASVLPVSYPRTWTLGAHFIKGDIYENHGWFRKAFMWDKRQLYKQLTLYYHCLGDEVKMKDMIEKESREYLPPDPFGD